MAAEDRVLVGGGSSTRRGHGQHTLWAVGYAQVNRCDPTSYGLLQQLEALSLDADTLRITTEKAVAYCDAQEGAGSVADLFKRASTLIAVAGLGSVS